MQVLSFAASVLVISYASSMLASTIELFVNGVYTRTGSMMKLGVLLMVVSLVSELQPHSSPHSLYGLSVAEF